MSEMNWFGFTALPPIGLRIRYRKHFVTLIETMPHVTKDGRETHLLRWRSDDGRQGTSGMAGNTLNWDKAAMRAHLAGRGLA